jgi:cytochrome P450
VASISAEPISATGPIYYDPYDVEIDRDPHPIWQRMREEQPIWWNERYQFWALSRFEDVWEAYHDTATFSSSHGVMLETLDFEFNMPLVIFMDPPAHDVMRKLVSRAFTPRRINDLRGHVQDLVASYLDPLVGSGGFDAVADVGALLPPMVIGHLLGVPEADRDMLRHWFDDLLHREDDSAMPTPEAMAAMGAVGQYATAMIADRRKSPRDDMISALIEAEVADGGEVRRLNDEEVSSFIILLAGAGVETVARFISWAAVLLARNPDQREILVREPDLVPNAAEEILRHEAPSPVNGRWTLRPFTAHGVEVPAGSKVLLLNGSANRDRREFDEPDRLDVRREFRRHLSFGHGAHFCLGAALARLEGQLALTGLISRFPRWDVDESALVRVQTSTVRGFSSVPIALG